MLKRALDAIREAKDAPRIEDAALVETLYRRKRNQVLLASMVGYALFYFCRNDYSIAVKLLQEDLKYGDAEVGRIGAGFFITYGVFKFLTGLIADRSSPRVLMITGLLLSAAVNVAFGLSSAVGTLAVLWALNGVFQSAGAPACAKIMATWFSAGERGQKTGIWNISHQGGGGLVLMFAGFCAARWGWRGAMIAPALVALGGAILVFPFLHDRPESHGLPPIEKFRPEESPAPSPDDTAPYWSLVIWKVLLNPRVLAIASASFCTYLVRYGALQWLPKFLMKERGLEPEAAGLASSLLEYLGIPGALLCGWLSDRAGGRRAPIVFCSLILLGVSTWALFRVPKGSPILALVLLGAIGFFTYGPQMLLAGVAPVDMSSKRVAAAAVGFTGFVSYFGASVSSYVTGKITAWEMRFDFWAATAIVGALLCIPLWYAAPVRKS